MKNLNTHLKALVRLAISDQDFHDKERELIYSIGQANNIPKTEIDQLIEENLREKPSQDELSFNALSFDEKFEYLYEIVLLMKVDSKVFLSEIRYCERLAEKLGFDKKVVSTMSSKIYSDPTITTDREKLKKAAKKFEL